MGSNFGDLKSDAGVQALNDYLKDKSYIEGFVPTQADVTVFEALGKAPAGKFAHALRFYNHISSYGAEKASFPTVKALPNVKGPAPSAPAADDDEEDADAARVRQERLDAYAAKKTAKPGPIARSQILLDCKPWDDETDMAEMEKLVRTVEMDGLVWGASKLNPVGFGIMKLSILCTVVDSKVSVDDLSEKITEFEDFVQSVDVAA